MSSPKHLKRCEHCGQWTDGALERCTHCGHILDKQYKEEIRKRAALGDPRVPIIQVKQDDPLWLKIAKRPVQFVQLIAYAIIAFLIYLTTVFAH